VKLGKVVENGDFRFFRSLYLHNQGQNYDTVVCNPSFVFIDIKIDDLVRPWMTLNDHFALNCFESGESYTLIIKLKFTIVSCNI